MRASRNSRLLEIRYSRFFCVLRRRKAEFFFFLFSRKRYLISKGVFCSLRVAREIITRDAARSTDHFFFFFFCMWARSWFYYFEIFRQPERFRENGIFLAVVQHVDLIRMRQMKKICKNQGISFWILV